jgi:hypothetical protein
MDEEHTPMDEDERGDDGLHALFERQRAHVAEQPFVNDVARRVAFARRRHVFATRATQAAAVGALIAASPWLVSGSALLSAKLDALFSFASTVLASPFGYGAGLTLVVTLFALRGRRLR